MDDFMRRPTEVMVSYLATQTGKSPTQIVRLLELGRIAMAMELITVVRIIDEYSLLPTKEDTIAAIQTLIVDQELLEPADEWYSRLSEWRRIKLTADGVAYRGADASSHADRLDAEPPRELPDAPPDSGQSQDPPCGD